MTLALDTMQLALFLRNEPSSALRLWTSVSGSEPAGFNSQQNGVTNAQGVMDGKLVTLSSNRQQSRVDIFLQGTAATPVSLPPYFLPSEEEAYALLRELADKIVKEADVERAGLILQASEAAKTPAEVVAILKNQLPEGIVPEGAIELNLQVVAPIVAQIPSSRTLTRLVRLQMVNLEVSFNQQTPGGLTTSPLQTIPTASIYVDTFSSSKENLNHAGTMDLIADLVKVGRDVIDGGYSSVLRQR